MGKAPHRKRALSRRKLQYNVTKASETTSPGRFSKRAGERETRHEKKRWKCPPGGEEAFNSRGETPGPHSPAQVKEERGKKKGTAIGKRRRKRYQCQGRRARCRIIPHCPCERHRKEQQPWLFFTFPPAERFELGAAASRGDVLGKSLSVPKGTSALAQRVLLPI